MSTHPYEKVRAISISKLKTNKRVRDLAGLIDHSFQLMTHVHDLSYRTQLMQFISENSYAKICEYCKG